jgi:protein SCO1/2
MLWLSVACAPTPPLTLLGTDLQQTPAPDLALKDENDKPFKLSEQQGSVVVLTFLYTQCPDECPLITQRLRAANEQLGKDRNDVKFVAVSLDPEHDTSDAIKNYLQAQKVEHILTYLRGTRAELVPIWKTYFLAVELIPGSTTLFHQSRVIVIDRHGLQRSNFRSDLETEALVSDVRLVLKEK